MVVERRQLVIEELQREHGLMDDEIPIVEAVYKTVLPEGIDPTLAEELRDRIAENVAKNIQQVER